MDNSEKLIRGPKTVIVGTNPEYCMNDYAVITKHGGFVHAVECLPSQAEKFASFSPVEVHNILFSGVPSRFINDPSIDLVLVAIDEASSKGNSAYNIDNVISTMLVTYPNAKILCEKCSVPTCFPDIQRVFGCYEWAYHDDILRYIRRIGYTNIHDLAFLCYSGHTDHSLMLSKIADLLSMLSVYSFRMDVTNVIQIGKATDDHCSFSITYEDGRETHHANLSVFINPHRLGITRVGDYEFVDRDRTTRVVINGSKVFEWSSDMYEKQIIDIINYPSKCNSFLQQKVVNAMQGIQKSLVFWKGDCIM